MKNLKISKKLTPKELAKEGKRVSRKIFAISKGNRTIKPAKGKGAYTRKAKHKTQG